MQVPSALDGSREETKALHEAMELVLRSLHHLYLLSKTGHVHQMAPAAHPLRRAWDNRQRLFLLKQQRQLESWVNESKGFKALLDKESGDGRRSTKAPVVLPPPPDLPQHGKAGAAGSQNSNEIKSKSRGQGQGRESTPLSRFADEHQKGGSRLAVEGRDAVQRLLR